MLKAPEIVKRENNLYLVQDLSGLDLYEKSKAIVHFCDKETKLLEREIDRAILEIFESNGINIPSTDKSVLKQAFAILKEQRKDIVITDNYADMVDLYNSSLIKHTKLFTIWLEDDRYLQCGVNIEVIKLGEIWK